MQIVKLSDFNDIYFVDSFFSEYRDLFGKDRHSYEECLKKLRINLYILDANKKKSISYKQFEKLKDSDLYAIRHISKENDRVIFAFIDKNDDVLLLSACKEKSTADYRKAIAQAEERMRILEGNNES